MTRPTLRELSSLPVEPVRLADSALVLIDCQNTYTQGVMELEGVQAALDETAALLDRARTAGIPVIHMPDADAAQAYQDVVARLLGEERPMRFTEAVKTGFFKRIFGGR